MAREILDMQRGMSMVATPPKKKDHVKMCTLLIAKVKSFAQKILETKNHKRSNLKAY